MIVGGLVGAAHGFRKEEISSIADLDEVLL
jgi:hypothetical protein